jgi:hypothetical protein
LNTFSVIHLAFFFLARLPAVSINCLAVSPLPGNFGGGMSEMGVILPGMNAIDKETFELIFFAGALCQ